MKIAISNVGASTCLGGAVQASAAFRAGLSGFSDAGSYRCFYPGDEEPQPVSVAALPDTSFGFQGVGRLVHMVCEALEDLQRDDPPAVLESEKLGVFFSIPPPGLRYLDDEVDAEFPDGRGTSHLAHAVLKGAFDLADIPYPTNAVSVFPGNRVGFLAALQAAGEALASGAVECALVGSVDSLVEEEILNDLLASDRLKTHQQPVGLVPGEGAVVLALTRPSPSDSASTVDFHLQAGREVVDREAPSTGAVLSSCVAAMLLAQGSQPTHTFVLDLNGEVGPSREWGHAVVRLTSQGLLHDDTPWWLPATSFGDTGAVSAALSIMLAIRSIERGYAIGPHFVITAADIDGSRAAASLIFDQN